MSECCLRFSTLVFRCFSCCCVRSFFPLSLPPPSSSSSLFLLLLLFIKEFPNCINLKWHWFPLKRMQLSYIVCAANCHQNDLQDCRLTNGTFSCAKDIKASDRVNHSMNFETFEQKNHLVYYYQLIDIDIYICTLYSFKCAYIYIIILFRLIS